MACRTLLLRYVNSVNKPRNSQVSVRFYAVKPDDNKPKSLPNSHIIDKELKFKPQSTSHDITITVPTMEDVGYVSGIPEEHIKKRTVRIYQPPKNAMQSGTNNINYWQIDFDTRERWENPLMGWCSTGDPHSNLKVNFASKDEAINHCEKMGWKYYVQRPNVHNPKPRSYAENFAWNKRTRVSTK